MQNYANEIEWLQAKITENPASMFYARLADRYLQMNEIDQAIEYAEKSTVMNPHDATARYILAKCRIQQEQYEKADKNLQELLAVEPHHLAALATQAELYQAQGERQQAEQSYNRIIDLDPFDDSIHQKIYDLRQEPESTAGTLEEDWNFDLAPEAEEKTQSVDESEFQSTDTDEIPYESRSEWTDEFSEAEEFPAETAEKTSFEEDPFSDFEEMPPTDESSTTETEESLTAEKKESREDQQDAVPEAHTPSETDVDREYKGEEVLDESIDDDFEIDRSKFREEKTKFTKLLDDIFSSNLEEEEQLEKEQRSTLEKIANDASMPETDESTFEEEPSSETPPEEFEPLMPPDQRTTPEEKILQNDRKQRDEPYDYSDEDAHETAERDMDQEELLKRNGDLGTADKNISKDFSQFLDSLDIREEMKETEDDFPKEFDDPLPNLDDNFELADDFDDILKPVSEDDDWMQKLSKDTPGYEEGWDIADAERESKREHESKSDSKAAESHEKKQDSKSKGKFFTPTLGEIYAAQGQYAKAISVFETLIKNEPDNDWYKSKLEYLKKKLDEQQ